MLKLEQTIDSREVAEMVEKTHSELLKDMRRYTSQFNEGKIPSVEFFTESTYVDAKGETRPCYRITKKGCEFIAHKLTGIKGTIFTARYINRFHEMQDILSQKESEPQLPWFIHKFRGKYIMKFEDFTKLTGVNPSGNYTAWKRADRLQGGLDYNGWAWYTTVNREEFEKEYGFDYGDDKCMFYLYPCGIRRALEIYRRESGRKINQGVYNMILDGLKTIEPSKKGLAVKNPEHIEIGSEYGKFPVQIKIIVGK
ncbi:MAG: Rha family transcriptional regulator [Candidatus Gastranaerophilales bacterium]|nr:Rha family transcriptional regulator [Candidatus Gastranaerophilales bacterium]